MLSPSQVGPADGTNEQRVTGDDKPGFIAAAQVAHDQANAVGGMPWRVHDIHDHIARLQPLAITKRQELKIHAPLVAFMQAVGRTCSTCQLGAA